MSMMKSHSYNVELVDGGVILSVKRNSDQQVKQYFLAGHNSRDAIDAFMENLTDDLASSYFPKPHKPNKGQSK